MDSVGMDSTSNTWALFRSLLGLQNTNPENANDVAIAKGPVIIFVSGEQGTSFATVMGHAGLEQDGEVVQRLLPVTDGQRPFAGRLLNRHVHDLQGGLFVRVDLAVPRELANHAVDALDRISRVNRLANRRRVVEQRDDVGPLAAPRLDDGRIFRVPDLSELLERLLGFHDGGGLIDG